MIILKVSHLLVSTCFCHLFSFVLSAFIGLCLFIGLCGCKSIPLHMAYRQNQVNVLNHKNTFILLSYGDVQHLFISLKLIRINRIWNKNLQINKSVWSPSSKNPFIIDALILGFHSRTFNGFMMFLKVMVDVCQTLFQHINDTFTGSSTRCHQHGSIIINTPSAWTAGYHGNAASIHSAHHNK